MRKAAARRERNRAARSALRNVVKKFRTAAAGTDASATETAYRLAVKKLDQAAAKMQKGLRVFLRDQTPLEGVAKRLEPIVVGGARGSAEHGDGEVSMVLMLGNGNEVEVKLPGRFKVSPQIAGAIKAVTGVVTVEAL